jgi:fructose-1,6-bisphosphatase/inositol monophosphatase family enzyme
MSDASAGLARPDLERFRDHALALADEARRLLRSFQAGGFEVTHKADGSHVTTADLTVESRLRAMTEDAFPGHGIVGEEFPAARPEADFQWIFDPVDGTENFVERIPTFGTIIGLHFRGYPVVGVIDVPMLGARVHAARGLGAFGDGGRLSLTDVAASAPADAVRLVLSARANFVRHRDEGALFDAVTRAYPNHRIYRSCYAHLCAATGQADVAVDAGNPIWDIAAAQVVVEEAGGTFRVVQESVAEGQRIFTTVFGRPGLTDRVSALLGAAARGA